MPEIWAIDVTCEARRLPVHRSRLDRAEQERAARFRREDDRMRFIVARSTRIELLAARLRVEPCALAFHEDAHGKPHVRTAQGRSQPFNSSHSGNWVLHAFAGTPIGVDVECVAPAMAKLDDFAWVLSPAERSFVLAHDAPEQRAAAMATVWVRKEAYVKALGEGLSRSLPDIGITCGDTGPPRLAFDRNPSARPLDWNFADLAIGDGYKACVAYAGTERPVTLRRYAPDCLPRDPCTPCGCDATPADSGSASRTDSDPACRTGYGAARWTERRR
ncbi:MAG: 4'-phosphopantetheinyl transferase superfamily protein [Burkholderiaceae bacterium]|nr:4'-phosphopantetheinyl transferase superfamily protein [Burkholderiaceae bacterium]